MDLAAAGTVKARPVIFGALCRASVHSGAAIQRSPNYGDPFHQNVSKSREHRTQKGEPQCKRTIARRAPVSIG